MTITISLRRYTSGVHWQVPGLAALWSTDVGTAVREATELALATYPHLDTVSFTLS